MADTELDLETEGLTGLFEADETKDTSGVYEIGYHILPTLSEAEVTAAVKALAGTITKNGGEFVGDKAPEKMDLAYSIQKRIGGKLTSFDSAYFGWMAFEIGSSTLATVKAFLDTNDSVLRYILVSTSKDEVTAVMQGAVIMPTAPTPTGTIGPSKRVAEDGAVVSEVALSQALDNMAAEDAGTPKEADQAV